MLEYFSYKKYKKHQAQKKEKEQHEVERRKSKEEPSSSTDTEATKPATAPHASTPMISEPSAPSSPAPAPSGETPLLNEEEQRFLELLTSADHSEAGADDDDEGPKPPLPPRVKTPEIVWDSDAESFREGKDKGKGKGKDKAKEKDDEGSSGGPVKTTEKIGRRISLLIRRGGPGKKPNNNKLAVPGSSTGEVVREQDDITRVLDDLNLSAQNNRVFSLSHESQEMVGKFTQVLKDLVNGVPTAGNDLKELLEDPKGVLSDNFEKLPSSLQKLVTQLPNKLTSSLAPELLAVAAESQGLKHDEGAGIKDAAMKLLIPTSLAELVAKPGAIVSMLKAIMNALKLRWPAFIGTNVIWSVAIFLLLFVLWYCHKRGKEVRLEKEGKEQTVEAGDRIEELPDDPLLPAPHPVPVSAEATVTGAAATAPEVPPPPKKTSKGRSSK